MKQPSNQVIVAIGSLIVAGLCVAMLIINHLVDQATMGQ